MKTITLLLAFFSLASVNAQTALPYNANFDNTAEQNQWKQYRLGQAKDPNYLWQFEKANSVTDSFALVHYYPVGGSQTTDDWMVSPELDLSNGAKIDSLFHYLGGFGTPQTADTLALYFLEGNQDPSLAATKFIVYDFLRTNFRSDNTWHSETGLELNSTATSGYLAFRYKTVVNWFDFRTDNIQVSPKENKDSIPESISENSSKRFNVFPNPASSEIFVQVQNSNEVVVKLFDVSGKMVLDKKTASNTPVSISHLEKGNYILEISEGNWISREQLLIH